MGDRGNANTRKAGEHGGREFPWNPTSNIEQPRTRVCAIIGCWAFDVGCFRGSEAGPGKRWLRQAQMEQQSRPSRPCHACAWPAVRWRGGGLWAALSGCSRLEVELGSSKSGFYHKEYEYNSSIPPPSGWSGGTLLPTWYLPISVEHPRSRIFDQASLSIARRPTAEPAAKRLKRCQRDGN